ncbi:MAG: response regulator [Cyanobacteriota bacterium]|nr:response regulator [Cyanobacteriota bacterium]
MDNPFPRDGWRQFRQRARALKQRSRAVPRRPTFCHPASPHPRSTSPMAMDPHIVDQGYMYFLMEAPELLQTLEQELVSLSQEKTVPKVHSLMRTAHTLKGSAASVGLETIKTVAHYLEDAFKALYSPEIEIDSSLEMLLLQGYDCLRIPLMAELQGSQVDEVEILDRAATVFAQLQEKLGDFMGQEAHIPTSVELGFDIAQSIFEVGVGQRLQDLEALLQEPDPAVVEVGLRSQLEVFVGLAESLDLPGFGAIAQTTLAALDAHPDQVLAIAQVAVADLKQARAEVLAGDRHRGGDPSAALLAWLLPPMTESVQPAPPPGHDLLILPTTLPPLPELLPPLPPDPDPIDSLLSEIDALVSQATQQTASLDPPPPAPPSLESIPPLPAPPSLEAMFAGLATGSLSDLPLDLPSNLSPDLRSHLPTTTASVAPQPLADPPSLEAMFAGLAPPLPPSPNPGMPSVLPELKPELAEPANLPVISSDLPKNSLPPPSGIPDLPIADLAPATASSPAPSSPPAASSTSLVLSQIWGSFAATAPSQNLVIADPPPLEAKFAPPTQPTQPRPSVRVDVELLERLNNLVGELLINQNRQALQNQNLQQGVQQLLTRLSHHQQTLARLQEVSDQSWILPSLQPRDQSTQQPLTWQQLARWGSQANFDQLELDHYSDLQLILQQAFEEWVHLQEASDAIDLFAREANQTLEKQQRMLTSVRDDVMQARMLPLAELFNRFPRMLRELSAKYGKSVDLQMVGSEVLVDKAVLEKLYEPLLHLIRNAFDHGIEPPATRRAQGKPEKGRIMLRAHSQGGRTHIQVSDDGQGLPIERIRQRAVEKGLLSASQAQSLPLPQLFDILFEPGFSTAEQVSELSGRGVGLDVVRDQLRHLKGTVSVSSQPQQGSSFTLQIPQTLTIAKLLVCQSGQRVYAFLSDGIQQILIPKSDQMQTTRGQKVLQWGSTLVPVRALSTLLTYTYPLPQAQPSVEAGSSSPLLLLHDQHRHLALEVEQLLGEQELVIKPLGNVITPPPYVYGCSILGDGRLALVVDSIALMQQILRPIAPAPRLTAPDRLALAAPSRSSQLLLVVDDSITLRQTLSATLQRAGYQVIQARDGREALEQLRQNPTIQMVICDVEMPHMNGFEFLSHCQKSGSLQQSPVVMLTSRSGDKHRQMAMTLGASAYLSKPYLEHELLATLQQVLTPQPSSPPLSL